MSCLLLVPRRVFAKVPTGSGPIASVDHRTGSLALSAQGPQALDAQRSAAVGTQRAAADIFVLSRSTQLYIHTYMMLESCGIQSFTINQMYC